MATGALAFGSAASAQPSQPEPAIPPGSENSRDPIITDDQFQAELPSLDPELGNPLEPLDQFQGPPAQPGETIPDAPVPDDPALAEPLPPLATFDVTTPEVPAGGEQEPPPVRYALTIEGLDETDLTGRFRELSALEDGDGEAVNGAQIAARVREDEQLLVRLLRSEGYYDATGTITIAQPAEPGGQVQVTVTAAPGDRYKFGTIAINGPETTPPGLPREALPLKTGDPIVAAAVEAGEANIAVRLTQQGYPFPEIGLRDILLDPDTDLGDYTLPVEPGPRARFGGYTTEGDLAFDAEHVGVLARFKRGDLFDSRKVDDLREAMVATNLFTSVSAEAVRTREVAPDGTEYVNILVRQDAGPARSLTASAGYATGEGFRLEGGWEHRNLFPPEGALRAAAVAGTSEQSVNVSFRRSNAGQRDRTLLIAAEAGRRDYAAFEGYTARLSGLISRESTPIWQKRWTYAYGAELIATNETQFRRREAPDPQATYFIGGLIGQLGHDRSDNLLNPTRGFRLLGRTNPEVSLEDGTTPYIRNQIDGSVYVPAGENLVVAARARFGSIFGIGRDELAPSRRFFAGGGGSVRGFGFQELGPKLEVANPKFDPEDPDEKANPTILVPIGGRSLTEFSLEGRYRFGDYGVVAFIDGGQVTDSETPGLSDLRYGIGVGGRLYTNFGPLRVDVATPLGRRRGESIVAIYVSIGQAF
ncbi:MAG TPA: BamA/TamA family outer membrane protein [Allosphingosinicella sp.]|uniref:autotransporter assembly complex protein TamA n=1 Tax=Allosphingosinicella sp. TaxID=2823234 RepID=UPI002F2A6D30